MKHSTGTPTKAEKARMESMQAGYGKRGVILEFPL